MLIRAHDLRKSESSRAFIVRSERFSQDLRVALYKHEQLGQAFRGIRSNSKGEKLNSVTLFLFQGLH